MVTPEPDGEDASVVRAVQVIGAVPTAGVAFAPEHDAQSNSLALDVVKVLEFRVEL
jgi:hypothetical protein